jgi:hypothetical protein
LKRVLEVSRSAFYGWHEHRPSTGQLSDCHLGERIQAIFDDSGGTYGWRGCIGRCVGRVCRSVELDGADDASEVPGWPVPAPEDPHDDL